MGQMMIFSIKFMPGENDIKTTGIHHIEDIKLEQPHHLLMTGSVCELEAMAQSSHSGFTQL